MARTASTRKLVMLSVGSLIVAGCAITGGSDSVSESGGNFKIGIIAPLSGALAEDGVAYSKAAKAAIEQAESDLDISIEVVEYDEASKTAEAVTGTRRLIQSEQVDAILSGSTSGNFLASRQVIDAEGTPVVTIATATDVVEDNAGWTFRVSQPLDERIEDNVAFAEEVLKAKAPAFLQVNDESQRAFTKEVAASFEEDGVSVVSEQYFQYTDTDFSPYLQKLRGKQADVTFLGCEVTQCATIIDQSHDVGLDTKFVLPTAASSEEFLESFGEVAEGAYVQTIYAPGAQKETVEFERAAEEGGFPTSYYSIVGYAEAKILAQAIADSGSGAPSDIQEALRGGKFDTPLGQVEFLENGQAAVDGYVAQVTDGEYVRVWPGE